MLLYVSSYYYICVLILLYVSSYYCECPHICVVLGDGLPLFLEVNSWRRCGASVADWRSRDACVLALLLRTHFCVC